MDAQAGKFVGDPHIFHDHRSGFDGGIFDHRHDRSSGVKEITAERSQQFGGDTDRFIVTFPLQKVGFDHYPFGLDTAGIFQTRGQNGMQSIIQFRVLITVQSGVMNLMHLKFPGKKFKRDG